MAVGSDYELWDAADGNCIVAELVRRYGRHAPEVQALGLLESGPSNQKRLIADGDDLVDLALGTAAA